MIRYFPKLSNKDSVSFPFIEKETVDVLVKRILSSQLKLTHEQLTPEVLAYFRVFLNDAILDQEYWPSVQVLEDDEIRVTPKLAGGSFGQIFKQVALIAVAIV